MFLFLRIMVCITGLTIANFVWQYFTIQKYALAVDRSFFELLALVVFAFSPKLGSE